MTKLTSLGEKELQYEAYTVNGRNDRRSRVTRIRVSVKELAWLQFRADQLNLTISEYVRTCTIDYKKINTLV